MYSQSKKQVEVSANESCPLIRASTNIYGESIARGTFSVMWRKEI